MPSDGSGIKNSMTTRFRNLGGFLRGSSEKRSLWLLFLLPVFFILHGYNENFGIIPLTVLGALFLRYFIITLFIIFINLLIFRSTARAFLFSFCCLVLFFFFGSIHDTLQKIFPGSRLVSYTLFLPLLVLIFGVIFWRLNRVKHPLRKTIRYITLLLIILCGFELLLFGYYKVTGKEKQNDLSGSFRLSVGKDGSCDTSRYPDIYFIVFDGYTSSKTLAEEFSYHNDAIDSLLTRNNFYTSVDSRSNYNFTAFSLASTFNLDYLSRENGTGYVYPKVVLKAVKTLQNNSIVQFLDQKGYVFRNFGRFKLEYMPLTDHSFFDFYYFDLIDKQTFTARVNRDIGWNFKIKNIFTGKFRVPKGHIREKKLHIERNQTSFDKLIQELNSKSDAPKFVYAHLMLPHEPFYLKEDGSLVDDSALLFNTLDQRAAYIGQVKYSNRLLQQIIELSGQSTNRNRVIIIEGDHGYRFYDQHNLDKEFPNLNTYYFSDHDYSMLYKSISPVNTFRVILNKYFCHQLPMLADTSIYLKKPGQ